MASTVRIMRLTATSKIFLAKRAKRLTLCAGDLVLDSEAGLCAPIYNCPCPVTVNGCNTCPCHKQGSPALSHQGNHCPYVDFIKCPEGCLVADKSTNCVTCSCPATPTPLLNCFNCTDVKNPAACGTIKQCGRHELCHTRGVNTDNVVSYHLSCMPRTECEHLSSPSIIGRRATACDQCCSTNLCNQKLC
ncbi:uncharacterized protein [Haliotis asinina]|uniref:uncharacterized protein n=1 Tax=Haliotis asinina TaxID=109174 RepID=UPI00353214D8